MENRQSCISAVKKAISFLLILFFIMSVAAVAWLFTRIAGGMEPDLFGYRLYIIATDSMSPELSVGEVILSKTVKATDIKEGDVVTFLGTSGSQNGLLITHKVVKAPYIYEDGYFIVTQGVKEGAPLDNPVAADSIKSVMVCKMEFLTAFFGIVKKPAGFMLLVFLPLAALAVLEVNKIAKVSQMSKKDLQKGLSAVTVKKPEPPINIPLIPVEFSPAKDLKDLQ